MVCRWGDRTGESGGLTAEDIEQLRPDLASDGVEVLRVYDRIAEARAKFPPGTRVIAARKHWGHPAGVVVGGGYTVDEQGPVLDVEFDGYVSSWSLSWLEPVPAAAEKEPADDRPCT